MVDTSIHLFILLHIECFYFYTDYENICCRVDYNRALSGKVNFLAMRRIFSLILFSFVMFGSLWVLSDNLVGYASVSRQIPTVSVPTVTSSPIAALAKVTREEDQINVRSGPGVEYPIIGVLIAGAEIPALGRSAGAQWLLVAYPGVPGGVAWVYAPLVELIGSVPIVAPPPTPTPRTTPTVDPTLAAQFIFEIPPTRLPTFTPPSPLILPTLQPDTSQGSSPRVPMGLLIAGLTVVGVFGALITFLRGR